VTDQIDSNDCVRIRGAAMRRFLWILIIMMKIATAEDAPLPLDHPEDNVPSINSTFATSPLYPKQAKKDKKKTSSNITPSRYSTTSPKLSNKNAKTPPKPPKTSAKEVGKKKKNKSTLKK
jgi:hypothetical protein